MKNPRKYLTKSIFKIGLECPRKLFYHKKKDEYLDSTVEDTFLQALAEGGYQVGALAKLKYPDGVDIDTLDYDEALKQTQELLKKDNVVIFEAAFQYKDFFVRSDIVVKRGNSLKLIEVKSKSLQASSFREDILASRPAPPAGKIRLKSTWLSYLYDIAFQTWVARMAHPKLSVSSFLMGLDKESINKEPNLHEMFLIDKSSGRTEIKLTRQPSKNFKGFEILTEQDVSTFIDDIIDGNEVSEFHVPGSLPQKAEALAKIYLKNEKFPAAKATSSSCKGCQFRGTSPTLKSGFDECWTEVMNIQSDNGR